MNDLKDKVVLITGASSGIGAAAALAFGRYGARVAVHYRSQRDAALSVVAQIQAAGSSAEAFCCDVMDSAHASNSVTSKDDLQAKLKKSIPMGRLGRPEECAGVLLFLASDELSSYVTG